MKSNSNLLNYIGTLLSDDKALKTFLVDPITEAEGKYGITKAERAVLRRTVSHLSNKSRNGYTVSRHLGSYRRSLRLLQNVLHNVGTKLSAENHSAKNLSNDSDDNITVSLIIYYPPNLSGDQDFTGYKNSDVQVKFGSPYTNQRIFTVTVPQGSSIENVMDAVKSIYTTSLFDYSTVNPSTGDSGDYVESISVYVLSQGQTCSISANIYSYDPNAGDDYVFWFYSINGQAGHGTSGSEGTSFKTYGTTSDTQLNNGDTIMWQLIAPDAEYGFQSCETTEGANYN